MYPSARDHIVLCGWPSIKEGLSALGIDAVEMEFARDRSVFAIDPKPGAERFKLDDPAGLDAFRKQVEAHEIRISAFLMSNNFASEDSDGEVAWTVAAIQAADVLGVPAIRIDAHMHGEGEESVARNIGIFANVMARILDATSDSKVDMGIENHGYQGNRPDFLDAVFRAVGSPRLGLTIDTGNFYWFGHPLSRVYEIIRHFAPHCKHTHAKNIKYPPEMRETQREVGLEYEKYVTTIWEGDIDHKRVADILKAAGYDRDLCLEDESLGRWQGDERREVIKRDIDLFKAILL